MPLTELIMKDPASDFFLKHQPLEYYKCHLHTVLEKEKEEVWGKGEVKRHHGDEAKPCWDVFISVHEKQRCEICYNK